LEGCREDSNRCPFHMFNVLRNLLSRASRVGDLRVWGLSSASESLEGGVLG
jgi:hypothetical protein